MKIAPRVRLKVAITSPSPVCSFLKRLELSSPAVAAIVISEFDTTSPTTNEIRRKLPVRVVVAPDAAASNSAWLPVSAPMP